MGSDRAYWERHARKYDRSVAILRRPLPRMLELVAEETSGARSVLEVAAGTGLVTEAIARSAERVVATDYSAAMVSMLRQRLEREGIGNVECAERDIYALGDAPGAYDAVVCANVLHLLPDLPGALAAMRAVLKPGGKLVAPTYCHEETALSRVFSRVLAMTGFPGQRRFSTASLRRALEEAGLSVHRQETLPGLLPIGFVAGTFGA